MKVEVTGLSSYEDKEDKFKEEVPFHDPFLLGICSFCSDF